MALAFLCEAYDEEVVGQDKKGNPDIRTVLHLLDVITPEEMQGRTATDIGEEIYRMMAADLGPDYAPLDAENS